MTQLNDAMYDVLKVAVPPARNLNDMIADWLVANGATGGAIPDLWDQFFDVRDIGVPALGNELFDMEALGAEKVSNSDFNNWTDDDPDDWEVVNAGNGRHITQVGNDSARLINDGSGIFYIRQNFMTAGVLYKVTLVVDAVDLDNIFVWEGGGSGNIFETDEVGTFTAYYFSVAGGRLIVGKSSSTATFDVTINSLSFKEVISPDKRITPPEVWPQLAGPLEESGNPTVSTFYRIMAQSVVDFTTIGALNNNVGTYFYSTGTGVTLSTVDSLSPVQLSWLRYGTNLMALDEIENAFKVTCDGSSGSGVRFNFIALSDLSSDLVIGEQYVFKCETKVAAGDNVHIRIFNGDSVEVANRSVTETDFIYIELVFIATGTINSLRLGNMSLDDQIWIRNLSIKEVIWTGDRNDRAYEWLESIGMGANPELITNGDMELDSNWGDRGTPDTNEQSMVEVHSGTYSRHIVANANDQGIESVASIPIVESVVYKLSAWVYVVSGSTVSFDRSQGRLPATITGIRTTTTGAWENIVGYATGLATGIEYMRLRTITGAGEFYVDDVSVKDVNAGHINDMWYNFWTSGAVVPAYLNMQEVVLFLVDEGWDATLSLRELQVTVESDVYTVGKKDLLVSKKKPDHVKLPNALKRGIKNALAAQGF